MKVIMDISGIDNLIIVSIPDTYDNGKQIVHVDKKEAREMAIETVCMIKETDIDIKKII